MKIKEEKITMYRSTNGKEFDNYKECEEYEEKRYDFHKNLIYFDSYYGENSEYYFCKKMYYIDDNDKIDYSSYEELEGEFGFYKNNKEYYVKEECKGCGFKRIEKEIDFEEMMDWIVNEMLKEEEE